MLGTIHAQYRDKMPGGEKIQNRRGRKSSNRLSVSGRRLPDSHLGAPPVPLDGHQANDAPRRITCLGSPTTSVLSIYFTTKRLHEQYMVSSGHNRWILCPLVQEGIIKFSVMPAGMKFRFSNELLHQFFLFFFK